MNGLVPVFQATGGIGGWALAIALVGTLFKVWPKLKELQIGSDGSLRKDLLDEIVRLRNEVMLSRAETAAERLRAQEETARERLQCDAKIAAIELRHTESMARLDGEIRGLENEMRQIVTSQARTMNAPISGNLVRAYPIPTDMGELTRKIDDAEDDA